MSGLHEGCDVLSNTFPYVATDNHIGFMEKDPVRYNDSLEAFEEVLKIAKSQDVSRDHYDCQLGSKI